MSRKAIRLPELINRKVRNDENGSGRCAGHLGARTVPLHARSPKDGRVAKPASVTGVKHFGCILPGVTATRRPFPITSWTCILNQSNGRRSSTWQFLMGDAKGERVMFINKNNKCLYIRSGVFKEEGQDDRGDFQVPKTACDPEPLISTPVWRGNLAKTRSLTDFGSGHLQSSQPHSDMRHSGYYRKPHAGTSLPALDSPNYNILRTDTKMLGYSRDRMRDVMHTRKVNFSNRNQLYYSRFGSLAKAKPGVPTSIAEITKIFQMKQPNTVRQSDPKMYQRNESYRNLRYKQPKPDLPQPQYHEGAKKKFVFGDGNQEDTVQYETRHCNTPTDQSDQSHCSEHAQCDGGDATSVDTTQEDQDYSSEGMDRGNPRGLVTNVGHLSNIMDTSSLSSDHKCYQTSCGSPNRKTTAAARRGDPAVEFHPLLKTSRPGCAKQAVNKTCDDCRPTHSISTSPRLSSSLPVLKNDLRYTLLKTAQTQHKRGGSDTKHNANKHSWPSNLDIERLRAGGFCYKTDTSDGDGPSSTWSTSKQGDSEPSKSQVSDKDGKQGGLRPIIVPSHTNTDCPLCNLYYTDEFLGISQTVDTGESCLTQRHKGTYKAKQPGRVTGYITEGKVVYSMEGTHAVTGLKKPADSKDVKCDGDWAKESSTTSQRNIADGASETKYCSAELSSPLSPVGTSRDNTAQMQYQGLTTSPPILSQGHNMSYKLSYTKAQLNETH